MSSAYARSRGVPRRCHYGVPLRVENPHCRLMWRRAMSRAPGFLRGASNAEKSLGSEIAAPNLTRRGTGRRAEVGGCATPVPRGGARG